MTAHDPAPPTSADVEAVSAIIEAHLSTGLGCHCGRWRLDTSQRPVDPRRQHRRHVAEVLAAALSTPTAEDTPQPPEPSGGCACCAAGSFDPDTFNDPDGYVDACFCTHVRAEHEGHETVMGPKALAVTSGDGVPSAGSAVEARDDWTPLTMDQIEALVEEVIEANAVWPDPLPSQVSAVMDIVREAMEQAAAIAQDAARTVEALARAYDDGYNYAATMARCYGHTDHWPEDAGPRNPYRTPHPAPDDQREGESS